MMRSEIRTIEQMQQDAVAKLIAESDERREGREGRRVAPLHTLARLRRYVVWKCDEQGATVPQEADLEDIGQAAYLRVLKAVRNRLYGLGLLSERSYLRLQRKCAHCALADHQAQRCESDQLESDVTDDLADLDDTFPVWVWDALEPEPDLLSAAVALSFADTKTEAAEWIDISRQLMNHRVKLLRAALTTPIIRGSGGWPALVSLMSLID